MIISEKSNVVNKFNCFGTCLSKSSSNILLLKNVELVLMGVICMYSSIMERGEFDK